MHTAFIDNIINKISNLYIGNRLNFITINIIAFTDNIAILASDATSLQKLQNIRT